MTIKSVVVGYDGSKGSQVALRWASGLSALLGAQLRIVHAVGLLEGAGLARGVPTHQERAVRIALDAGADPNATGWALVDGDPCSALIRSSTEPSAAYLVVVGTRGAGAHGGSLLGSTSLELVEHSKVPVAIIPAPDDGEPGT